MSSLKEIYDVRKTIVVKSNIDEFQSMLDSEGIQSTLNTDKTIRVESSEGLDKITDSIDDVLVTWCDLHIPFAIHMLYNLLPLNNNMCLLKF